MSARPANVLLIDADESLGHITRELLQQSGWPCELVHDGDTALDHLDNGQYDIVVADIMEPDEHWLYFLEQSQACPLPPTVILLTASSDIRMALASLEKGAFACKIKPLDIDELLDTVEEASRRNRLLRGLSREKERNREVAWQMRALDHMVQANSTAQLVNAGTREYVGTVLTSAIGSLMDVLGLMDMAPLPEGHPAWQARHPDIATYREAIHHSIKVLEATKSAFKSRELAELRRKLDVLLQVTAGDKG